MEEEAADSSVDLMLNKITQFFTLPWLQSFKTELNPPVVVDLNRFLFTTVSCIDIISLLPVDN